jgi:hypothetical protein
VIAVTQIPDWLVFLGPLLTTLIGGGLALLGGWLTTRHQLQGEHRARVEARLDRRRDRRDAYLEGLTKAMDEMLDLRARQASDRLAGRGREVDQMTGMIRTGFLIRSLLGRVGDDDLTNQADAWMDALQAWGEHAVPEDQAGAREVRASFDLVNRRVGELLRES